MSIRVMIDDVGSEVCITLHASGPYSPDVADDLTTRALQLYRDALENKLAAGSADVDE